MWYVSMSILVAVLAASDAPRLAQGSAPVTTTVAEDTAVTAEAARIAKADHDRRVKLDRAVVYLRRKGTYLRRVNAGVAKAQKELDWARSHPTYTETVKSKRTCPACNGTGKGQMRVIKGKATKPTCPRCGGSGRVTKKTQVRKTRDLAPYVKLLADWTGLQQQTQAEYDELRRTADALREPVTE